MLASGRRGGIGADTAYLKTSNSLDKALWVAVSVSFHTSHARGTRPSIALNQGDYLTSRARRVVIVMERQCYRTGRREGEKGRGFAVVAGEVRALARRSAAPGKDIERQIGYPVVEIAAG
jgi:hypothetical protein